MYEEEGAFSIPLHPRRITKVIIRHMTKDLNRDLRRVMKTGKSLLHPYEGGQGGSHGRFRIREGPLFFYFLLAVFRGAIRKGIRQIPAPRDSRP